MRTKVEWAGVMALAATVLTALLSAQGSGAAASDLIPILTEQKPAVEFVSRPMVQALPAEDGVEETDGTEISPDADSLRELVSQQSMPDDMSNEMRCLAGAIYFEARGETLEGQLAVGRVIVNRSKSGRFPTSYCGVVYQPSQFSFVRGRSMPSVREGSMSWREAVAVAQIADEGTWKSPAKGALFFHATRVSPNWRLTRLARVDNHVFYR
ncbi:hydrolase [Novosphingobium barchaimii LL02]|jgi:N-acetylmuramoyl-L-alanine amidase|uniref:Hydrolase n=1 Tax=Novosphingobium barchaimii LL02 TaxID=1114963 RepID=A0A0J7XMD3_9SPHN|nr:cell wall hydrolase [Novosphingobium barchaimii]KMS52814.1 hydrolase [Novosphingobium barchaimii LL02]